MLALPIGGALEENSLEDAQAQFETNVFGVLRMLKAVLPAMRRQGSGQIITVSSLLGVATMPYLSLYSSSKFAVEGWHLSLCGSKPTCAELDRLQDQ